jgi:hypothetical protein
MGLVKIELLYYEKLWKIKPHLLQIDLLYCKVNRKEYS